MRERLPGRFLERRLKDQSVLELADDHHLGNRVLQPGVDLSEHVVNIRVDEPVKLIGVEAKPGCRLEEAIGTLIGTTSRRHQLPELEAHDSRVVSGAAEATNELRRST